MAEYGKTPIPEPKKAAPASRRKNTDPMSPSTKRILRVVVGSIIFLAALPAVVSWISGTGVSNDREPGEDENFIGDVYIDRDVRIMSACEMTVQNNLKDPSSYKVVRKDFNLGTLTYSAKNAFNARIQRTIDCNKLVGDALEKARPPEAWAKCAIAAKIKLLEGGANSDSFVFKEYFPDHGYLLFTFEAPMTRERVEGAVDCNKELSN